MKPNNIIRNGVACYAPTLAAILALAFTACDEKSKPAPATTESGSGVKLLESKDNGDGYHYKYEYDSKDRIVKISDYKAGELNSTQTITYSSDKAVKVEIVYSSDNSIGVTNYAINGNTITSSDNSDTLTINKDGYIIKNKNAFWSSAYQYKDNNLVSITETSTDSTDSREQVHEYGYDNKKPPLHNSNTPKWLLSSLGLASYKNNVTSWSVYGGEVTGSNGYEYEYDSDGFPTKQTKNWYADGEEGSDTTTFTYIGK
jgi:hypothetical protein